MAQVLLRMLLSRIVSTAQDWEAVMKSNRRLPPWVSRLRSGVSKT